MAAERAKQKELNSDSNLSAEQVITENKQDISLTEDQKEQTNKEFEKPLAEEKSANKTEKKTNVKSSADIAPKRKSTARASKKTASGTKKKSSTSSKSSFN